MAYSEKQLSTEWIPQVRFPNGEGVTLETVRASIQDEADANGIPVAFRDEQLKVGGLFSKTTENVLEMYNPEHAFDYLTFVIRVQYMGKYAFMHVFNMGGSKNFAMTNAADGDGLMGSVAKLGNLIGGRKAKLEAEQQYYTILQDVLSNVTGV